jgi:hypothetical protein
MYSYNCVMKAHRFLRLRGSNILYKIGSQIAVKLPALRPGRRFNPRKIRGTKLC